MTSPVRLLMVLLAASGSDISMRTDPVLCRGTMQLFKCQVRIQYCMENFGVEKRIWAVLLAKYHHVKPTQIRGVNFSVALLYNQCFREKRKKEFSLTFERQRKSLAAWKEQKDSRNVKIASAYRPINETMTIRYSLACACPLSEFPVATVPTCQLLKTQAISTILKAKHSPGVLNRNLMRRTLP